MNTINEKLVEYYMEQETEELENLLQYPQDIETGCDHNCDICKDEEIGAIKEAIRRMELRDEHIRE